MQMRKSGAPADAQPHPSAIPKYDRTGAESLEVSSPYIISDPSSWVVLAEEYRKLKSMVVRELKHLNAGNTLMVTSAGSGEGKSLSAINLAITLAQELDNTVLLIDTDLRRPSLGTYFNLGERPGLTECLVDGVDPSETLIKTDIGRLTLLPAGRQVGNPTELLASQKMRSFFGEVKHRYRDRYIILDAPPVLPVAETRIMASLVDGIIFVVAEGKVAEQGIRDALDILRGNRMLGLVFNNVSPENLGAHYESYYYVTGETVKDVKDVH